MASSSDQSNSTWVERISQAILSSPDEKMLVNDMYNYLQHQNPAYYTEKMRMRWKNSIHKNLHLEDCFQKKGRSPNGCGWFWGLHPAIAPDFRKKIYYMRDRTICEYERRYVNEQKRQNSIDQHASGPQPTQDNASSTGHPQPSWSARSGSYAPSPTETMTSKSNQRSGTWVERISKAILSSSEEKLLVRDIYNYIQRLHPTQKSRTCKKTISNILSKEPCFQRMGRLSDSRRSFWGLHPAIQADFRNGKYDTRDRTIHEYTSRETIAPERQNSVNQDNSVSQGHSSSESGQSGSYASSIRTAGGPTEDTASRYGSQKHSCHALSGPDASSPSEGLAQDTTYHSAHSWTAQSDPYGSSPLEGLAHDTTNHSGHMQPSWPVQSGPSASIPPEGLPQDSINHSGHLQTSWPAQGDPYGSSPSEGLAEDTANNSGYLQHSWPAQSDPYWSSPSEELAQDTINHSGHLQPSWPAQNGPHSSSLPKGLAQDSIHLSGHLHRPLLVLSGPSASSPSEELAQDTIHLSRHLQSPWPAQSGPYGSSSSEVLAQDTTNHSGHLQPSWPAQSCPYASSPPERLAQNTINHFRHQQHS